MFKRVLSHFESEGTKIDRVRGVWGERMPDNLDSFNRAVREGAHEDVAARGTKTGQWASDAGYKKVSFVEREGPLGNRTKVVVDFRPGRGC